MASLSFILRIPIHGKISASPFQRTPHEIIHHFKLNEALDICPTLGNKSGMKKLFSLEAGNHKPARLADKIKSDVRKYLKRERSKELPEGVDFWDFDCRQGESAEVAEGVHEKEIGKTIDAAVEAGWQGIYLEILAKPGIRKKRD